MSCMNRDWRPYSQGQVLPVAAVNADLPKDTPWLWRPMAKEAANTAVQNTANANTAKHNTAGAQSGATVPPTPTTPQQPQQPSQPAQQPLQSKEYYSKVMKDIESNKPRESWTAKDYQDYYGADYDRHISMYGGVTPKGFGTREEYIAKNTSRMQGNIASDVSLTDRQKENPYIAKAQRSDDAAMRQRNIAVGERQLQGEMQRAGQISGQPYSPNGTYGMQMNIRDAWHGGPGQVKDRARTDAIARRVDENGQVRDVSRTDATRNTSNLAQRFNALAAAAPTPNGGVRNLTDNYVPAVNLNSKEDYDEAYNWLINNGSQEALDLARELYTDSQARFGSYGVPYQQ